MLSRSLPLLSLIFPFLWLPFGMIGQTIQDTNDNGIIISLLTCDAGDELYSTFGHSAVRVVDDGAGTDIVYNYGTFDDSDPAFYLKFMQGYMNYMLTRSTYRNFLYAYSAERRNVRERELLLRADQEEALVRHLEFTARPENRVYPYDFFYDNCATRIRDLIPAFVDPETKWNADKPDKTFRDLLHEHLPGMPWSAFGIDLIIGANADKVATVSQQMFLPVYLEKHFSNATIGGNALCREAHEVLVFDEEADRREQTPFLTPHLAFLLLVLLELLFVFGMSKSRWVKYYNRIFFFALGVGSLVMLLMWFATEHTSTTNNWNIIWMSPLFLLFPWMKNGKNKNYVGYVLIAGVVISLLNTLVQFLPQAFNMYNMVLYGLIIWKVGRCIR